MLLFFFFWPTFSRALFLSRLIDIGLSRHSGTETPDSSVVGSIDLRKDKSLFKVISQEEAKIDKSDLVGRYMPL